MAYIWIIFLDSSRATSPLCRFKQEHHFAHAAKQQTQNGPTSFCKGSCRFCAEGGILQVTQGSPLLARGAGAGLDNPYGSLPTRHVLWFFDGQWHVTSPQQVKSSCYPRCSNSQLPIRQQVLPRPGVFLWQQGPSLQWGTCPLTSCCQKAVGSTFLVHLGSRSCISSPTQLQQRQGKKLLPELVKFTILNIRLPSVLFTPTSSDIIYKGVLLISINVINSFFFSPMVWN